MPIYSDKAEVLIMQYNDGNGADLREYVLHKPRQTPKHSKIAISKSQFPPNTNGYFKFFFIRRSIEKEELSIFEITRNNSECCTIQYVYC